MLALGGVDASVLDETPIERVEQIASERVEAKQIENRVETTLPWKGEQGLKVVYDMGEPTLAERTKDKRDREVVAEPVTFMSEDGTPNGFKVDVLLNEKPDTNRFCYTIEGAEDYNFFYQPEITDEEAEEERDGKVDVRTLEEIKRFIRPENIVGSYAVYHKSLKDNGYKTGKVMHIPRPQVWSLSDESKKVWADLSYDAGELCVTVPQKFIDTATYPVRVDPTFGYTSAGASSWNLTFSTPGGSRHTLSAATANVTSVTAHGFTTSLSKAGRHAIYTESSLAPVNLVASSSNSATYTTSASWQTTTVTASITAADYWLMLWIEDGTGDERISIDTGSGNARGRNGQTYPNWPNPFGAPNVSFNSRIASIYATYDIPTSTTSAQDTFWFD